MGYAVVIRRPAVSPQPTGAVALPRNESESELGSSAVRRQRKRKRQPGGLGRGLGRILTDSGNEGSPSTVQRSGLLQLVGGEVTAGPDRIRDVVVDAALGAMMAGFSLDGVVLVAQAPTTSVSDAADQSAGFDPTFLAAKLPPSWSADSQLLFEIYGNLWWLLQDPDDFGVSSGGVKSGPADGQIAGTAENTRQWQIPLGENWLWLCRMHDGEDVVAAVAIRPAPFEPTEANTLSSLVNAVVTACSNSEARAATRAQISSGTRTTLKLDGEEIMAEVVAEWHQPAAGRSGRQRRGDKNVDARRLGAARAADVPTAVARAAAKACRPRCQVTFAGSSEVDEDSEVSIVMIDGPEHGLRMGFAVRQKGDNGGAAEAVFTAALG